MIDRSGNHSQSTQQAAWQRLVEVHETLASNRMKFSITLSEMSDYLSNYVKAKESVRRRLKETEQQNSSNPGTMQSSAMSKTKNVSNAVSGIFGKHKGMTQESLERLGQEAGVKTKMANESYKRILQQTNTMRRDFYDVQLPKILASVMGLVEE
ncbi:hypothetical protein LPJ57_002002, partial [Coemansia sp. RSA 486]